MLVGFETLRERCLDLLYAEHAILFIHCHGAAESSCDVRPTSSSSGSVMSYSDISACSVYGVLRDNPCGDIEPHIWVSKGRYQVPYMRVHGLC